MSILSRTAGALSTRRNLGFTKSEAACMAACIGVDTLVFVIDQQQQGNKDKTKHRKKSEDFGGTSHNSYHCEGVGTDTWRWFITQYNWEYRQLPTCCLQFSLESNTNDKSKTIKCTNVYSRALPI